MKQTLPDYLSHILDSITQIIAYVDGMDETSFRANRMVQDAVIRNFEIVGEASNNITTAYPEFLAKYPSIPLKPAYWMRNTLAHGYFTVDLEIVWRTIHTLLPDMFAQVHAAHAELTRSHI